MRRNPVRVYILLFVTSALLVALGSPAVAADVNCSKCHRKLTVGKSVHKAVNMACSVCHRGIDAGTVPHRKTNALAGGLSSEQPDLCYGCHDKKSFAKKNVHAAVGMGCTGCHNPHVSQNPVLLKSALPELCYSCHEKGNFTKEGVHAPVASGECTTCHSPHASDEMALLRKKPVEVCTQCHADTPHGNHISSREDPQDPNRPGTPFYCGSCHNPHSTDSPLLFKFDAQSVSELCVNCHKF
jgi:predicted CXXCH cytochrome family protein